MPPTLILGQMLWADTTGLPQRGWGVAVDGTRVVALGPHSHLRSRFPDAEVVDAADCVITPAFVNAHHHMYGVLAHGIPLETAPAGFWPFLEAFWWPRVEDRLTHDLIVAAADWACLEMVRSGVTTFYDCLEAPYALPDALEAQAEVVRRWGLRGVLSFEATERVSPQNGMLGLNENVTFIDRCRQAGGMVSGMMCFHTTFTCSTDFIQAAFALAAERDARIHMHVAEGSYEPEYCLSRFGLRTVRHYDRLGLLGPRVLASQCVQVDGEEIAALARRSVHVSHQPLSNCEVGGGFSPVPEMSAAGINVALGTDGYVNNFFEVMRAAALLPKARLKDPGVMSPGAVWTMATQNGARALGFDDLGTLTPGGPADLLLIAADLPTPLTPQPSLSSGHSNLAEQLLLWRNPSDLKGVMCAGRWLLRNDEVIGVDENAVRARVAKAAAQLWQ
jgi:cytosine/adenosine deaminase-related metal-dependent hydrolase